MSPDTAIRLGKYFGVEPEYWLKLQSYYDIEFAKDNKKKIEKEVVPYKVSQKIIENSHNTKQKYQTHKKNEEQSKGKSKIALHR